MNEKEIKSVPDMFEPVKEIGENLLNKEPINTGLKPPKLIGITEKQYLEYQSLLNTKEKMTQLHCYLESEDFKSNFESISNEVYIKARIKNIIGLIMSEEEFGILKNKYYKIDTRPSFTTRKLKEAEEQLYKIKNLIGSYDEISTLEDEIYKIIGDSNE